MTATPSASILPISGGTLVDCGGTLLRVRGRAFAVGVLASVGCRDMLAECVGFEGDASLFAPLTSRDGLTPGLRVTPIEDGNVIRLAFGRTVNALGRAIDGAPMTDVDTATVPPPLPLGQRGRVKQALETGVRAIDGLLTIGRGQRILIAAPPGVGKTTLLQQILCQTETDAVVIGLIGERGREVADFAALVRSSKAAERTIVVAATSDEAAALRLRAARRAHDTAAVFRAQGKSVLLLIDSLTRIAQAQREIGLALGEPAGLGAYPPSAYALIPTLVERAGVDSRSGGSITAIYTVLAEAGDLDDPILDAARGTTDGHIVLSRSLAERGMFPAIDCAASLSRTMADVVSAEHLADAREVRRLWSLAEEHRELRAMGLDLGLDADRVMVLRSAIDQFIAQPPNVAVSNIDSRAALASIVRS